MSQLEDYFEKQAYLPAEVKRNLELIRKLDDEVTNNQHRIQELQKHFFSMQKLKKPKEDVAQMKDKIDHLFEECLKLSSEKIQIADKTYSLVDNSVRELDDDLRKFEDQLKQTVNPEQNKLRKAQVQLSKYQRERRKKIHLEIEQSKEIFQANIGMNEPVYCLCQQPSFGQIQGQCVKTSFVSGNGSISNASSSRTFLLTTNSGSAPPSAKKRPSSLFRTLNGLARFDR